MFDPKTSEIISYLEKGEILLSVLAKKSNLPEKEVLDRLSYLIKHNFIFKKNYESQLTLSANLDKLNSVVENENNFDGAIDGLTKMDSYLN